MSARTLMDVWSGYASSWTGDLDRDMAERGIPPEQAHAVALRALASNLSGGDADVADVEALEAQLLRLETAAVMIPAEDLIAVMLSMLMLGVEWNREARRNG